MPTPKINIILNGIDNFSKTLKQANFSIQKFGKGMESLGKKMTAGLTLPILGIGVASIKASTDFNSAMANVATLIPGNIDRVRSLKKSVQDLAISTGKSTADIAGGLYQIVSAFGDGADTAEKLNVVVRAGKAGLADTTSSLNLLSAVTKTYGDTSAGALAKVADLAFKTVELGQTTFPELAGSIGSVAPLAENFGVSMEELFGVLATATGVTGNTSEVTTQFAGALAALMKPTPKLMSLIKHLGYSSARAMIQEEGFVGAMSKMATVAKKNNVELIELFGRKEATILITALSNKLNTEAIRKTEAMTKAQGAMNTAFKEQTEGINKTGFAMEQFLRRLEVGGQKIGDTLAPSLNKILDMLAPMLDKFVSLPEPVLRLMIVFAGILAILGPILLIAGKLIGAISLIAANWGIIAAALGLIKALVLGIGAAIGATGGLIIAAAGIWIYNLMLIKKNWQGIVDVFSEWSLLLRTVKFFLQDIGQSLLKLVLPKWLEKKLGLTTEEVSSASPTAGAAATAAIIGSGAKPGRQEVVMSFENVPRGSRVIEKKGTADLSIEYGLNFAGAQ